MTNPHREGVLATLPEINMQPSHRQRLTTLFYLLTRDHLPWGALHALIDKRVLGEGEPSYTSEPAHALAAAAVERLLGPDVVDVASMAVTVDTSVCSFKDAMPHAIALAQTHLIVRFKHNCATVAVEASDTPDTLRDRWQREADHVIASRQRVQNDGRACVAHDLRDAGFTSASWNADARQDAAITLSRADAEALLTSGVRMREGKVIP